MSDPIFHTQIIPMPEPEAHEFLATYQITYEFSQEVQYREAFEEYFQWHCRLAEQHQQELEAMQNDIDLFGWFCRR